MYGQVVAFLQAPGQRSGYARPDRQPVDGGDGQDLGDGAAQEHLVGDVQLGAVDLAVLDGGAGLGGEVGGVISRPSRTIIMQAPGASATLPRWLRIRVVAKPLRVASCWAIRLLW